MWEQAGWNRWRLDCGDGWELEAVYEDSHLFTMWLQWGQLDSAVLIPDGHLFELKVPEVPYDPDFCPFKVLMWNVLRAGREQLATRH